MVEKPNWFELLNVSDSQLVRIVVFFLVLLSPLAVLRIAFPNIDILNFNNFLEFLLLVVVTGTPIIITTYRQHFDKYDVMSMTSQELLDKAEKMYAIGESLKSSKDDEDMVEKITKELKKTIKYYKEQKIEYDSKKENSFLNPVFSYALLIFYFEAGCLLAVTFFKGMNFSTFVILMYSIYLLLVSIDVISSIVSTRRMSKKMLTHMDKVISMMEISRAQINHRK